ncbi:type II secretion system protein [Patescibacteria group bacterium]|nr:type II secretion system protein [Patescibacteria group bacterium]
MRGFTTLEVLLSIAVLIILSAIVIGAFATFRDARELDRAVDEIFTLVREARSRTLSSEGDSQFGVHFETSNSVLFKGATFTMGAPNNKTLILSNRVEIFAINILGSDVVFERLTGDANPSGDVSVRLKADPSESKTIIINSSGLIYVQ